MLDNFTAARECSHHSVSMGRIDQSHAQKASGVTTSGAGLQPIGPIASNRAPHLRGPRAMPTNLLKLTFYIEAVCVLPAPAHSIFKRSVHCQRK